MNWKTFFLTKVDLASEKVLSRITCHLTSFFNYFANLKVSLNDVDFYLVPVTGIAATTPVTAK